MVLHPIPTLTLACLLWAWCIECAAVDKTSSPSPLSFAPSLYWDGDGNHWSTFWVQIGTGSNGPQAVRLLPSITGGSIYPVWDVACNPEGVNGNVPHCNDTRGGLFNNFSSSSFQYGGYASLPLRPEHWIYGDEQVTSMYGYDNITVALPPSYSLGWPGAGSCALSNASIFTYFDSTFPIGTFGIWNYTDSSQVGTPLPNLLGQLRDQNVTSSRSWGYLAGAVYRSFPTLYAASLIFGGYDASRMNASASLTLAPGADEYRPYILGVDSITTDGKELLTAPINNVAFDSQVSSIWLPLSACRAFEDAFGLVWNDTHQMYLLDDAQRSSLTQRNPNITFGLNNTLSDSERLNITLPYGAFDMQTTFPLGDGKTHYFFPLQRATSDTQYTLGRTILQEIYMVADFERGIHTLYQAVYPLSTVSPNIITICPKDSQTCKSGSGGSSSLSAGVIAGIVVGASMVLIAVLAALWYKCWRRPFSSSTRDGSKTTSNRESVAALVGGVEKPELEASTPGQQTSPRPHELDGFYAVPKPELDSGYTSPHALTGSGRGSNPRDARSVRFSGQTHESGGAEIAAEAGGAEVHEMTAWEEQNARYQQRSELAGSPGRVRHELHGSTSWPPRREN